MPSPFTPPLDALCAHNIFKTFGKRPVLMGINLYLKQGEAVGLLGPNGAGKTTCFSIMTGLIQPDRGSVYLDQVDITRMPMHRRARQGVG
ncbi:MAG: ATP-binding cassette domain-containing protein, partial [Alphaproteobacteria bacterium]|nr:ATP-binding cassette domain-containing protein [Alphaproteobacteria bacterium]